MGYSDLMILRQSVTRAVWEVTLLSFVGSLSPWRFNVWSSNRGCCIEARVVVIPFVDNKFPKDELGVINVDPCALARLLQDCGIVSCGYLTSL